MQNIAKNYTIKIEIFDYKGINANNKKEDIEEKNKKNIDLSIIDIYSYTVAITHMY